MKLRRDDNVLVIKGRDRGKQGRIQRTFPEDNKVLITGINVVMRHMKPTQALRQAGIIQKELPMQAANVMLVCTHCNLPTRVVTTRLGDGTKARLCGKCKEVIE